jgi:hypothetical protein
MFMTLLPLQFVGRASRLVCGAAATAACTLAMAGCGSTVNGNTANVSQLRIIDATPDAGGLDIYAGSGAIAYNLGFGTVTSYVVATPSTYTISADTAGTKTALSSVKATLLSGKQYSLLISNVAASLQTQVITDQSQPAPSGQISLRFLDESLSSGSLDLYLVPSGSTLAKVTAIQQGVAFGANTGYLNVSTGTYTLYIVQNGTVISSTVVPLYAGPATAYPAGSARTILITDQQLTTTPAINVTTIADYDSATATQ